MPFELKTSANQARLILVGRLGVQQARSMWDAMQPAIAARQEIRVEAGELEDMDTSIVQILCRVCGQSGQIQIGETSDGFLAALQRRGLEQFFVHATGRSEESQTPQPEPDTKAKAARQGHG
jgi:ABC-type transporter Mla MlaB component